MIIDIPCLIKEIIRQLVPGRENEQKQTAVLITFTETTRHAFKQVLFFIASVKSKTENKKEIKGGKL